MPLPVFLKPVVLSRFDLMEHAFYRFASGLSLGRRAGRGFVEWRGVHSNECIGEVVGNWRRVVGKLRRGFWTAVLLGQLPTQGTCEAGAPSCRQLTNPLPAFS